MLLVCLMLPTLHSDDLRINNTSSDPRFVLIMLEFEETLRKDDTDVQEVESLGDHSYFLR